MKQIIVPIALLAALSANAQSLPAKDMQFAKEAAQAGLLEVKLGELARQKASSENVKTLGQHMITDHTKANEELKALASSRSISLPEGLSAEGQKNYDRLSKKTGSDFDKAYATLMVKDHQEVIAKFKTEASAGADQELKNWAGKTLPTLEHHLMMSKETDAKIHR